MEKLFKNASILALLSKSDFLTTNSSIKLLRYHLASSNVKDADIAINPKIGKVGWNKFIDSKSVILAGEEAMQLSILQLKELIKHRSNSD